MTKSQNHGLGVRCHASLIAYCKKTLMQPVMLCCVGVSELLMVVSVELVMT